MGASTHWMIPVIAVLLLGGLVTAYLFKIRLPRDENAAGLVALAGMTWRDFINVVLGALTRRGYTRVFDEDATRDDSEYILERDGKRWLLSCKHGSAFVLGSSTMIEMANIIRLNNLAGGLLLTQGRVAEGTRPVAALQHIELLEGPTLWPELRDLIPSQQRHAIEHDARARARKQVALVWLLVVLAAIALVFTLRDGSDAEDALPETPAPRQAVDANPPAPAPADAAAEAPAKPAAAAPAPTPAASATEIDATQLEKQRSAVADAVSTLPMVDRAVWSTRSTLQVYLANADRDAKTVICPLLEAYPALASSRVQLTPPPESEAQVRFVQCRTY